MSLGIYVHIPFCASKCNYCDFNSSVESKTLKDEYVIALCKEIQSFAEGGDKVDSIYFGGGTPTVLEVEQLSMILGVICRRFSVEDDCEITTECNPATMGYEDFVTLKRAGFNRMSIGMQSADIEQLKILGRIHTFEDCKDCVSVARRAGFDNISLDLMFGLPNQNVDSFIYSIKAAAKLGVEHISCYALKIEEGTPFATMKLNIADDDTSGDMYKICVEMLKRYGYDRYEISNFSKEGFESRHNKKYWQCDDFVGFGAGAYSCYKGGRYSNIYNTGEYIECITKGKSPICEKTPLSRVDMMSEFVFLGLRMDIGISKAEFKKRFDADVYDVFKEQIDKNINRGTIVVDGDRFKIPEKYTYVSNSILADFV